MVFSKLLNFFFDKYIKAIRDKNTIPQIVNPILGNIFIPN